MIRLLDTNAYTAFRRGDERIVSLVRTSSVLLMSPIVLGELRGGFLAGSRTEENLRWLDEFLSVARVHIVSLDEQTSGRYGEIYAQLRRIGRPIPMNDMWIAAHCLQRDAQLITLDQHFSAIEGLEVAPLPG